MLWGQVKVLLPSFMGYWFALCVLACCVWYGFTRAYRQFAFKWQVPVLFATAVSFYMCVNTVTALYQNSLLQSHQQAMAPASAAKNVAQADPGTQLKQNFLNTVEKMIQNPGSITPEAKKKLFTEHAALFKDKNTRGIFQKAVSDVYHCERVFWEDAFASFKAKQVVKSDSRKECETASGAFFNREKLLPGETVKQKEATIASFAARKRVPASDGKQIEVNEAMLRDAVEGQNKNLDTIKKIFE